MHSICSGASLCITGWPRRIQRKRSDPRGRGPAGGHLDDLIKLARAAGSGRGSGTSHVLTHGIRLRQQMMDLRPVGVALRVSRAWSIHTRKKCARPAGRRRLSIPRAVSRRPGRVREPLTEPLWSSFTGRPSRWGRPITAQLGHHVDLLHGRDEEGGRLYTLRPL